MSNSNLNLFIYFRRRISNPIITRSMWQRNSIFVSFALHKLAELNPDARWLYLVMIPIFYSRKFWITFARSYQEMFFNGKDK